MKTKSRLDVTVVERGLAPTRAKAQALIMARRVRVDGAYVEKPGASVAPDAVVEVVALEHPWVSRGGMKLAHALRHFEISVEGKICADIGASTGGFTDVMLKNGAAKVYAVDVGRGQIDQSLRSDPRVVNREGINARYIGASDFDDPIELVAIDASFISLKHLLPAVAEFLEPGGTVVALIKPQFEVGKGKVGKGGIVRDETKRRSAIESVVASARENGFDVVGVTESPIKGAEGNVEYLMYAKRAPHP